MANIAIIGAAGYLGVKVVEALNGRGHNITAITRPNGEIILGQKNVRIVYFQSLKNNAEKFDVIINLAYATSSVQWLIKQENTDILELIKKLAKTDAKIIHTSTLAVFGFGLDKEIKTAAVKNRADYSYIVSKIGMENLLLKSFPKHDVSIIRLGNIWGPASASWTVKILENLLYEKPVVADAFGYSNITDVYNTADYIRFLAEQATQTGTKFYHQAELGDKNWDYYVNALAEKIHAKPVYSQRSVSYHTSIKNDLAGLTHFFSPSPFLYGALETRFLAFYLRDFISGLPRAVKKPFNKLPVPINAGNDFVFLTVMSCKTHFINQTHPDWKPPVNAEESLKRVFNWMEEAGYHF
ncbi:MAG: NAD-dependent epimerase/dehydratase family protein [Bacteroidia bacterium]